MALTPAQLTTLKADILANTDPDVVEAVANNGVNFIANWYNDEASPSYWIYRATVSVEEVRDAIDLQDIADITAADSDRVVKLLAIREETGFSGENPRDRSAWDDVFSAAAGDNSQQAILALWTRLASYAEAVFALSTGTGADAANADTTSWQGVLSGSDVTSALNS